MITDLSFTLFHALVLETRSSTIVQTASGHIYPDVIPDVNAPVSPSHVRRSTPVEEVDLRVPV